MDGHVNLPSSSSLIATKGTDPEKKNIQLEASNPAAGTGGFKLNNSDGSTLYYPLVWPLLCSKYHYTCFVTSTSSSPHNTECGETLNKREQSYVCVSVTYLCLLQFPG